MKKITLILIFLIFNLGKSQIERNYGDTPEPVPSASSFSSYVNTPVSLSTGVPNINIPLLTLPTSNKNFQLVNELNYHVYNTGANKPASEVGLGWSLFKGGGVISRVINGSVDEYNYDPSKSTYKKNLFDDIYYYDFPGNSGKFKFVRDTINNTFSLNNISGNNLKIEYTRDSNTATLILNTFKITDGKGFKYVFEDYSIARYDTSNNGFNYKSAFYLTRILDENNLVIANFSYLKNTKNIEGTSTILYQNCKLESVSTQHGKITYENILVNNGDDDPYIVRSLSLWDMSNHLISKYRFSYNSFISFIFPTNDNQGKRTLSYLEKLNKNQEVVESRNFFYDQEGSETGYGPLSDAEKYGNFLCPNTAHLNPKTYTLGLLKKMTFPEGGSVVYNFEANEVYQDKSNLQLSSDAITDPDIQYLNLTNSVNFDTNTSRNYTFQLSETKRVFVKFIINETYEILNSHGNIIIDPEYKLLNSSGTAISGVSNGCSETAKYYNLSPGTYTLQISRGNGNGVIENYVIANLSAPYKNRVQAKVGARIASIKYYDTNNSIRKAVSYKYDSFDNINNSSGERFYGEVCDEAYGYFNETILYKNVKETFEGNSENMGYSKYYFKVPSDYTSIIPFYKPHINITSSGLVWKKEIYNQQNQIQSSENTEYVMEEIPNVTEYNLCGGYKTKSSWIRSITTNSKMFYANGSNVESQSETRFNQSNFQPSLIKTTSSEGKITEKSIKYASDLFNTRLVNANMLSVPLQTEVKMNGNVVSKGETKYDTPSNLYPSSMLTFNMQNQNAVTTAVFNEYDSKGNLVQMTVKNDIPVTTIWGYYQTQPIAQIIGATYSEVSNLPSVIAAVVASNADADNPVNEASLLLALDNLRNDSALQSQTITVYTYDPLIGTTNTVSPNGIKTSYIYDVNNRLLKTVDSNGKTLKEYQYNYRQN